MANTGTEDINNLTLSDDLADQFGTAFVEVVGDPIVTGDLDPTRANVNFDGDTDIALITAAPLQTLTAGEDFTVTFTVTVDPLAPGAPDPLENAADAGGTPPPIGPPIILPPEPPTPLEVVTLQTTKTAGDPVIAASGTEGLSLIHI